eukprot:4420967-Amphidinium_carterae.1
MAGPKTRQRNQLLHQRPEPLPNTKLWMSVFGLGVNTGHAAFEKTNPEDDFLAVDTCAHQQPEHLQDDDDSSETRSFDRFNGQTAELKSVHRKLNRGQKDQINLALTIAWNKNSQGCLEYPYGFEFSEALLLSCFNS